MRSTGETAPWPFGRRSPGGSEAQFSNGREYMTVRTALLSRYAVPWLLALHDQDQESYANILYETCVELADDRIAGSEVFDLTGTDVSRRMKFFESALRERA